MSADYAPAVDLQNAEIGWGGWQPSNRHWIIVHGTAGDATIEAVQQTYISNAQRGEPTSTHYAVGVDGRVGQYVPESGVAWGNGPITGPSGVAIAGIGNAHDAWWNAFGNANPETISIEHCKTDTGNNNALTLAQQTASFALIAHLCARWGIPRNVYGVTSYAQRAVGGITGHFSMDPINRAFCPGTYPWAALQTYLNETIMAIQLEYDGAGNISGAHDADNPAMRVGGGMAQVINDNHWLSAEITVPELWGLPSGSTLAVLRGTARVVLTYSPAHHVTVYNGDIVPAVNDLYNLWKTKA